MKEKGPKLPSGTDLCDRVLQSSALELGSRCMEDIVVLMNTWFLLKRMISAFGTTLAPKVLVTSIPTESDIRWL